MIHHSEWSTRQWAPRIWSDNLQPPYISKSEVIWDQTTSNFHFHLQDSSWTWGRIPTGGTFCCLITCLIFLFCRFAQDFPEGYVDRSWEDLRKMVNIEDTTARSVKPREKRARVDLGLEIQKDLKQVELDVLAKQTERESKKSRKKHRRRNLWVAVFVFL